MRSGVNVGFDKSSVAGLEDRCCVGSFDDEVETDIAEDWCSIKQQHKSAPASAIASTNAIVAASCCNEAFKIMTGANPAIGFPGMNNYMMYTGDDSVYTYTFEHQKKDDCPVCGNLAKPLQVDRKSTLQEFIESLRDLPEA